MEVTIVRRKASKVNRGEYLVTERGLEIIWGYDEPTQRILVCAPYPAVGGIVGIATAPADYVEVVPLREAVKIGDSGK
jgi:hypothetical protein